MLLIGFFVWLSCISGKCLTCLMFFCVTKQSLYKLCMPNNSYWWRLERKKIIIYSSAWCVLTETWRVPKAVPELENSFFFPLKFLQRVWSLCVCSPYLALKAEFSGNSSVLPSALPCRNAQSPGIIGWFVDFNQLSVQPDWNGALQGGAWSVQSAQRFCGVQVFAKLRVLFTHS